MKKAALFAVCLVALIGLAEAIVLLRVPIDPLRLGAALGALALTLSALVGFTQAGFVKYLRRWAVRSGGAALATPLLLLVPYLIYAFGTNTFSLRAAAKLTAYIVVPTALLLPDRLRPRDRMGWRDLAAMLALALPAAGHWLEGIWPWPEELYFFRPFYSVCIGAYAFMVVRNLEGIGYRLGFRKGDVIEGSADFVAFGVLGIPLGIVLDFIHPHAGAFTPGQFALEFFGTYLTIAIPEEFLFRGILQNFLVKSIRGKRRALYGIVIASVAFGAAHLHHPPVPNWKYGVMATLAGMFYGNAFRARGRISASALTHTLVDTVWHFWF